MSLSGGFSFFEKNKALFQDGVTALASSNSANASLVLSPDVYFKWLSTGSDDTTTETLTITFPQAVTFDRIFLIDHNFKEFSVTADGITYSNVKGVDETGENSISESEWSRDFSYYEFDEITTTEITISVVKTQVANEEKSLGQLIVTSEIGTLLGFPSISGISIDPNNLSERTLSDKERIQRGRDQHDFNMTLNTYPFQDDIDLLDRLFQRVDSFLVWPCGGNPDQFRIKIRGWRGVDIFNMQMNGRPTNGFRDNVYKLGVNQSYTFSEVS